MKFRLFLLFAALTAGCGGGGGGGDAKGGANDPPTPNQSPGGIWHAVAGPADTMTLFIAESGEMTVMASGPAFGSGAVVVNSGNQVSGTFQLRTLGAFIGPAPAPVRPADQTCTIEGTVTERVSLQLTISCAEPGGNATERTVGMAYDPQYATNSSLAEIAGNYTLGFSPQTNILNINSNGVVFGLLHNGAINCTVNGNVEIIDADFNLYRFEFSLSLCQGIFALPGGLPFEGATLTGLGFTDPPGAAAGSVLLLITAVIDGRLEFLSVLYEPV